MIIIMRKHTAVAVRGVENRVVMSREKTTRRLPQTKKKRKSTPGSWIVNVRSPVAAPAPLGEGGERRFVSLFT
jgi:hypothetical protein